MRAKDVLIAQIFGGGSGGGGGGGAVDVNADVRFIDYDGEVVDSYSAEEFASLSALPANPSHEGLIAQGWNWSLADAKSYVANYGMLDIGQNYATESGYTEFDVELTAETLTPSVRIYCHDMTKTYYVDWGDGSEPDAFNGNTIQVKKSHTYAAPGQYTLKYMGEGLRVSSGISANRSDMFFSGRTAGYDKTDAYLRCVKRVRLGNDIVLGKGAFGGMVNLESVTIPGVPTFDDAIYVFQDCASLKTLIFPKGWQYIFDYMIYMCRGLESLSFPNELLSIGTYGCAFNYSLRRLSLGENLQTIGAQGVQTASALRSVSIPPSVTNIGTYAFADEKAASEVHIYATTPPTLGANAFMNIAEYSLIYVPAESVDAYKAASNWSSYASMIVGE